MSKKQEHIRSWKGVVPRFLAIFFASALIVFALGAALFFAERDNRFEALAELEQGRLRLQTGFVERAIAGVSGDLTAMSRNQALGEALRFGIGTEPMQLTREGAMQLAQDIENFARAKGVYDRLLLHDQWEREVLRMENGGTDPVVVFPELAAWETEPPPMTLDELPTGHVRYWMPEDDTEHLYFATAIGHEDSILGSLVLAYRSSELLSMIGKQRGTPSGEFRIIERGGRTLFADADEGEAFDPVRTAPGTWTSILADEHGQVHDESGLTSFNTLAPGLLRRDYTGADSNTGLDDWKLISHLSAESMTASIMPYFNQLPRICLGVLAALALGSLLLALGRTRSLQTRRKADADRDRYHRILDSGRELVITTSIEEDSTGGADLLGMNRAGMKLFGFDEDELLQMSVGELVAESSLETLRRHLTDAREGRAAMTELEMRDRNGATHIIEIAFQRGSAEDGGSTVLRGVGRDVAHRKRTEDELNTARGLLTLEAAVHEALAGVEAEQLSARLVGALSAADLAGATDWCAIYRTDPEGVLHREAVHNETAEAFLPVVLPDSFRSSLGDQWSRHLDIGGEDGSPFTDSPPSGQQGCWIHRLDAEAHGLLLVFTAAREVTADAGTALCSRAARTLAWRLERFAVDDQLEAEQVSALSHQNEQVTATEHSEGCMLGIIERMRRQVTAHLDLLSRQAGGSVPEAVSHNAWALRRSVEEVNSFARLEVDELATEQRPFAWREVLKAALGVVASPAAEKGIAIRAEIEKQIPNEVEGDATHLRQVLDQLLANAVAGTERGEVRVKVQLGHEEKTGLALNFIVTDTGIGIPDEQLQNLFAGLDPGGPGLRNGRGLGLPLASRLVERMGGRLWVQSSADEGSSFHFTAIFGDPTRLEIPDTEPVTAEFGAVATPPAEAARRADQVIPAPACVLNVLLAESTPKSRDRVVDLLTAQGHTIKAVDSGIAAVEAVAQVDYDVILLAAQMNEMDGLTAARAIRDCGSDRLPIVALSAEASGGDRTRCEAAGMDHYLSKPIAAKELLELMNDIAGTISRATASVYSDNDSDRMKEMNVDLSVFDRAAAMDRVGDDLELLIEVAGMFLEDYPDMLKVIEADVISGDPKKLELSAHTFKGAVGNFSAKQAFDAAFALEQMGKHDDMSDAPRALEILKQEVDRLAPILNGL